MESNDQIEVLRRDLQDKLKRLDFINECPALYVSKYFEALRADIDVATETKMAVEDREGLIQKINSLRLTFVDKLNKEEKVLQQNLHQNPRLASYPYFKAKYEDLKSRVDKCDSAALSVSQYESLYEALVQEILEQEIELENLCLKGQTFFYVDKFRILGVLVHLKDDYLSPFEIASLK